MTLAQYTQASVTQPSNVLQTVQGQARPQMVSKILPQQNFQVKPLNVGKSLIPNQQIHISHIHNVGGKPVAMVAQSANLAQQQPPVTTMTALKRFPGNNNLLKYADKNRIHYYRRRKQSVVRIKLKNFFSFLIFTKSRFRKN